MYAIMYFLNLCQILKLVDVSEVTGVRIKSADKSQLIIVRFLALFIFTG